MDIYEKMDLRRRVLEEKKVFGLYARYRKGTPKQKESIIRILQNVHGEDLDYSEKDAGEPPKKFND